MVTYVLPIGNIAGLRLWIPVCGENDGGSLREVRASTSVSFLRKQESMRMDFVRNSRLNEKVVGSFISSVRDVA